MNLIGLVLALFICCLLYWAATRLLAVFGIGEPIHTIVIVVLVILFVFVLLGQLGVGTGLDLGVGTRG